MFLKEVPSQRKFTDIISDSNILANFRLLSQSYFCWKKPTFHFVFFHLHYCKVIHAYEEDIIHLHIPSCPYSKSNMFMSYTWRNTAVSVYLYVHVIQSWHYNWIASPSDNVLDVSYYIINGISKLSNMVKYNNCNWQALTWFVSIGKDWKEWRKKRHFWISPPGMTVW